MSPSVPESDRKVPRRCKPRCEACSDRGSAFLTLADIEKSSAVILEAEKHIALRLIYPPACRDCGKATAGFSSGDLCNCIRGPNGEVLFR